MFITIITLTLIFFVAIIFIGYFLFTGKLQFSDRFFTGIDNFMHGLNDWFGKSAANLCKLETGLDEYILTADDGSLVSVIELHGSLTVVGQEEFTYIMDQMNMLLSTRMGKRGYSLQVIMTYDPEEARYEVAELMRASRNTVRNLGMSFDDMLDDWESSIAQWCASEHVYLVMWTTPKSLSPVPFKNAKKEEGLGIANSPNAMNCQIALRGVRKLEETHRSSVIGLIEGFSQIGLLAEQIDAHKAIWVMRRSIDKSYTGRKWRASLPGDALPAMMADPGQEDLTGILYPKIGQQIFPRLVKNITDNILKIGHDTWHASLVMIRPPQNILPFNVFFRSMLTANMPWRVSFLMHGDGLNGTTFKQTIASILHYASTNNKMFNAAIDNLKGKELSGSAITTLQINFSTSIYQEPNAEKAIKSISENASVLATNAQSWGSADVRDVVGDPVLGLISTLPGTICSSVAPKAVAPLEEAVMMMPFTRPASLWRTGNTIYRTSDGKLMPYQMGSSLQAAWVDLGVAPMGGGKSVLLNTLNFSFCTQEGLTRLPWLSILDIGPSSSGIIELIKASLPEHKQYLAQYHRLRMEKCYSINPFDLPLGMSQPTPSHKSFLVNFLSLLCTEVGADSPIDGVSAIARCAIDAIYEELSPGRSPKLYQRNVDYDVDKLVDALNIRLDAKTSWWEIRDQFFLAGYVHEATRAQRFAVPLLDEVAAMALRDLVTGIYQHSTPNNERITSFFWRQCVDAIGAYPILKSPTQFDIGDAQIVSLDMDEVAPRGGAEADRQTAVMYMLGRHVLGSRFFLMPEDVKYAADIYYKWHEERIDNIRQDPKRLCYDEMHRVIRNASVSKQVVGDIETISRESRKWNLSLGVYSQSIDDFPEIVIELATSLYILGVGTTRMAEKITKLFGLNETALQEMQRLGKPDKKGANFLGIFKSGNKTCVQRLTNTIGMQALWAFETTTENVTVRNKLYKRIGVPETLKRLAHAYPGGLKAEVEKRKRLYADMTEEESTDIINQIVNEIELIKTGD